MNKQKSIFKLAFAFVGMVVGAGFASGQEILQYFVSYGYHGLIGAFLTALVTAIAGVCILQLGSYYLANEHFYVFNRLFKTWFAKVLDVLIVLILFCFGFVMLAGASANLQQQFQAPLWLGSLIVAILVVLSGLLNVDKVLNIIGSLTPVISLFVLVAAIYTLSQSSFNWASFQVSSLAVTSPLPHWLLAAINYVGMTLVLAVPMAIVMGGDQLSPKLAGLGGLAGGLIFGVMMLLATLALFIANPSVKAADMPLLELVNQIDPRLGTIMALAIFGMIYNTAVCMFYALAKRAQAIKETYYRPCLFASVCLAFGCSFLGFKQLINRLFPIIGWVGLLVIALLVSKWWAMRPRIKKETRRRRKVRKLLQRKLASSVAYTKEDANTLVASLEKSNIADHVLYEQALLKAEANIEANSNLDLDKQALADAKAKLQELSEQTKS